MPVPLYRLERLGIHHDRTDFQSGEPALDDYLARLAGQDERRDVSRTFVLVHAGERPPGEPPVLGYYTLAAGAVAFSDLPEAVRKRLPRYPIPVAHLGRLAVDQRMQGRGLGKVLLVDALQRALRLADTLGVWAVEVRAKHDAARSFYLRYGFTSLPDDPLRLYLPLATVRGLY